MQLFINASLMFSIISLTFFTNVEARQLIGTSNKYINVHNGQVIEINSYNISEDQSTARYYDYGKRKNIEVNLKDYSKSTRDEIARIKAGKMILIKINDAFKPCQVWYLFENQMASIGCKSDKIVKNVGVDRHALQSYTVKNVASEFIIPEVDEKDNFKKHNFYRLGNQKIRIENIFDNGEVLVQKMNASFFDTSSILMKFNIIRTNLSEISTE